MTDSSGWQVFSDTRARTHDTPVTRLPRHFKDLRKKLPGASKEFQCYSPRVLIGDKDLFGDQELRWKCVNITHQRICRQTKS
ncbi:hypothetical protein TNCV_1144771 [Trichonephila clavipes]|nr:hypothetical protein TNCV_1144771 [Trichonephila clavipes]